MSRRELARRSGLHINTVGTLAYATNRLVSLVTLTQVCATVHVQPGQVLVWKPDEQRG